MDVNVVDRLGMLGERRRDLARRVARERAVTDAISGASLPHDLLRERNQQEGSAAGTAQSRALSES